MPDDPIERLEILVHSAAPTSRKEDDRLRAQALACLRFQPTKRTLLTDITFTRGQLQLGGGDGSGTQRLRSSRTRSQTRKSRENSQQEAEMQEQRLKVSQTTKFRSRIIKSTHDSSIKALKRSVKFGEDHVTHGLLSQTVDAGISPMALTPQEQSQPRLENLLDPTASYEDEPPSSYATSRFDSWESPSASIPDSQPFFDNPILIPFIPPSDPPAPPSASGAEEDEAELSNELTLFNLSGASFSYAHLPPKPSSLPPISPHLERSHSLSESSLTSLNSASYPSSPRLPEFNPSFALRTFVEGPYEILFPVPNTDSNPEFITPQLKAITMLNDGVLMERYQKLKKSQVRELREWERGYWSVDTSSWIDVKTMVRFWNLLKDNVAHGRLGFVNVFLDDDEGVIVKVYCFGGIAERLWCALFVMSSRSLTNAKWIDAGNNEIIKF